MRASLSAPPRLGQVNLKQRFFYMKDNLYESIESFEPPLRKTPVSHTIPARVGSRGGFDAQVKNS